MTDILVKLAFLLLNTHLISGADSQLNSCAKNDNSESCPTSGHEQMNKYSKEANVNEKILKRIQDSEEEYVAKSEEKLANQAQGDTAKCSMYTDLIEKDLSYFANGGISEQMIKEARVRGTLYQIIDGKLYREESCKFPARCQGIEHFLLKILGQIPKDIEFVVNVSDWPQVPSFNSEPYPVFSFSKTSDYIDITYPAWSFWEGGPAISLYPKGLGRWDLLRKSLISTSRKFSWDIKESKGFFRGSRTCSERDNLIQLSRQNPELVDAKYTKNQAWKSIADTLGEEPAEEISLEEHCKYKYLFNFRGVAASFRFKHLFLCNSLVLHVGSDWIEFFYHALKPWVHYIPIEKDSSIQDIKDLLQFVQSHDEVIKRIADRGFLFIKENLKLSHITCYWRALLTKYSNLIKYKVKKRPGVVLLG